MEGKVETLRQRERLRERRLARKGWFSMGERERRATHRSRLMFSNVFVPS